MVRLHRSLAELEMAPPIPDEQILAAQERLVELNEVTEGLVYLQVSRGVADRDFAYPVAGESSLVMFTQEKNLLASPLAESGIDIITLPDIRWQRRDIKTVGLLGPCMAKQAASKAGVHDAWMVEDGYVTEGTSNNAYIVRKDGTIQTRHLGTEILSGITRTAVLQISRQTNHAVLEQAFTVEEAKQASEAFITSASTFVMPVVSIDGAPVGDGKPGPLTKELRRLYIEIARERQQFDAPA